MSDLNWEPFKINREEIEWSTMKNDLANQIARAFGIPPSLIGIADIIVEGSAIVLDKQLLLPEGGRHAETDNHGLYE